MQRLLRQHRDGEGESAVDDGAWPEVWLGHVLQVGAAATKESSRGPWYAAEKGAGSKDTGISNCPVGACVVITIPLHVHSFSITLLKRCVVSPKP